MSSLRLALKQSLQESGQQGGKRKQQRGKNKQLGDKRKQHGGKRKRGRPKKADHPQSQQGGDENSDDDERTHPHDRDKDDDQSSSSEEENEFISAGEENEEDSDEEDNNSDSEEEGEEDHLVDHQEWKKKEGSHRNTSSGDQRSPQEGEEESNIHHGEPHENDSEDDDDEDEERKRRQERKLQKKLKHFAANTIQREWKKKKEGNGTDTEPERTTEEARESESASAEVQRPKENPENEKAKAEDDDQHDDEVGEKKKKKTKGNDGRGGGKGKTAKTVPPPEADVLEWNRALPVKRARRNVAQGLRVKVRFATKVKRDGKILRKKKWFGGRVSAVSKEGSKIRIKYDDGTSEISKFPDKDVVVCDAFNGSHQCDASKFQPPQRNPGSMVMDEERAQTPPKELDTEKKHSPPPPSTAASEDLMPKAPKEAEEPKLEEAVAPPATAVQTEKGNDEAKPNPTTEDLEPPPPTPQPEQGEICLPSPKSAPIEDEVVRPPSPPIPTSPPKAETQMASTGVPKLKLTVSSKPATQPSTEAAKPIPQSTAMGDLVPDEKQEVVEAKVDPIKTMEQDLPSAKPKERLEPESDQPIEKPSVEKAMTETFTAIITTEAEEKPPSPDVAEIPEETPSKPSPKTDVMAEEQQGFVDRTERDEKVVPIEMETEALSEMAAPTKPSLTIRLANPKRRGSGTEPKSPRIKISTHVAREDADEEELLMPENKPKQHYAPAEPAVNATGRKSPKSQTKEPEKPSAAPKRRRPEDEIRMETDPIDLGEPPTKRIHLQYPGAVNDIADISGLEDQPEQTEIAKPKLKRPSSRQSNESAAPSKSDANDDGDDGPVKIVGRVSAKRVPLFSDEEEDASVSKPRPETPKEIETEILQKPQAVAGSLPNNQKEEDRNDLQLTKASNSATPGGPEDVNTFKRDKDKVSLNSRCSAFDAKTPKNDDAPPVETAMPVVVVATGEEVEMKLPRPSTPGEKPAPALETATTTGAAVRSGRRAAQQAHERIVSTTKEADKDPATEKKRKRQGKNDEDSESSNEDVNNWVQCFGCKKWRIIPNNILISNLPDRWYCSLSADNKRNTCDAPEQTARTPVVKKKKRRKKMRQRAEAAAVGKVDVQPEVATQERPKTHNSTLKDEPKVTERDAKSKEKDLARGKEKEVTKPKEKETAQAKAKPPRASPNSMGPDEGLPQQRDVDAPAKKTKHEKKTRRLPDEPLEPAPEVSPPEVVVKGKRGRKRKEQKESSKVSDPDQGTGSFHGSVSSQPAEQDPDNVEWVQCDSCGKWRKLPPHISADDLPEVWYCSNKTWDRESASCDAPEDKADGQQDIGPSIPSPGGSKLSYRNLIFGSGRKVNRPVSERTRAAESIFATPSDDSDSAYPTVKYVNSSAFSSRGSRATNLIEDESNGFSIFDLMHHSNLFAELRGASQSFYSRKVESASLGRPFVPKFSAVKEKDLPPTKATRSLKIAKPWKQKMFS